MAVNTIPFTTKARGYSPVQVDAYFQKIAGEYSNLQHDYEKLKYQFDELKKQSNYKMDAIAKVMVDAEAYALKTVSDAKAEVNRIIEDASRELAALRSEKASLVSEINTIVGRLKSMEPER